MDQIALKKDVSLRHRSLLQVVCISWCLLYTPDLSYSEGIQSTVFTDGRLRGQFYFKGEQMGNYFEVLGRTVLLESGEKVKRSTLGKIECPYAPAPKSCDGSSCEKCFAEPKEWDNTGHSRDALTCMTWNETSFRSGGPLRYDIEGDSWD